LASPPINLRPINLNLTINRELIPGQNMTSRKRQINLRVTTIDTALTISTEPTTSRKPKAKMLRLRPIGLR
jgi:hypothetical protein